MKRKKGYWEKCPLCQARMKNEHLDNEEDLQGYFMKRMSDYVCSKGRKVIGWDELTNSSFLPEGVIIQGWRGLGNGCSESSGARASVHHDTRTYHVSDSLSGTAMV